MKALVLSSLVLTLVVPCVASASGYEGYQGYSLGKYKGDNHTNTHEKVTDADYIMNKVEKFEKTDKANFWADNGSSRISKKYSQNKGNTTKIKFDSDENLNKD